jgi:putative hydrolase of the HAD superfamily
MKPEAILFDLDDTILADDAVYEKAWRNVFEKPVPRARKLDFARLWTAIRRAGEWYYGDPERLRRARQDLCTARREVVAMALSSLGIDDRRLARELADSYGEEKEKAVFVYPDAIETLSHFRKEGTPMALLTNGSSEHQRKKIERFELAPFFSHILIEGELGMGKPDEQIFRHALELLEVVHPSQTWMVGDRLETDVSPAQKLGIYAIWVDWRGEGLTESSPVQPDRIIRTLSELLPK